MMYGILMVNKSVHSGCTICYTHLADNTGFQYVEIVFQSGAYLTEGLVYWDQALHSLNTDPSYTEDAYTKHPFTLTTGQNKSTAGFVKCN